jgi:hypothetical protein
MQFTEQAAQSVPAYTLQALNVSLSYHHPNDMDLPALYMLGIPTRSVYRNANNDHEQFPTLVKKFSNMWL